MSSEKRKKNNEARMKVYSKNKEKEDWNQYEHHIVEHHHTKHKHTAWHWSRIPEEHLYHAGYINEFNKHRLERLAKFKEGTNPHKDYGLDGLSMDSDKTYHGLQAKYFLTNKVSANDIGTFQSVTRRLNKKNPLSKGYLYTSSSLEATLAEDIKCIGDIIHEKVLFEPEDKRTTRHQKKVIEEINLPLRQYQKDALESLKEEREGIATLSLFCGGGKTLIAGHYLSELKPKIIVMIAPLKISVDNLYQRMESFFNGYEHLVIDSDSGNTTDADLVKEKLDLDKPIVLYTTFASAVNVLSPVFDEDEELFEDSFCLVDECHNIVNKTELCEFISRFYDGLLMSATIPEELYEVIDCEPVYEYCMAEAIKEGYCVDYNVWLPLVVKKEETNSIEIDIPEEFEKSDLCAKVLFLVNGMLQTGSKRCIVYLHNTDECPAFNKLFTKVCKEYHGIQSWTETIDCDVKQEKRRSILEDFQSEKEDLTTLHILASVRILDEAVDVVRCDSEFITYVGENADDKRAVQRLQRGGRLDSTNPSKRNNLFIWCNEYASMLSMLSLLKESDPEFHTKLRILNGSYDAVGKKESVEKSAVQLGDLQKYVEVRCLSNDEVWEMKYNEMVKFWEENKRKPIYSSKDKNEKRLGGWISDQITKYNKEILTKERIISLEKLEWWSWDILNKRWYATLENIIEFHNKNNKIPLHISNNNYEKTLGLWINTQRYNYKKGIRLSNKRIEKLNALKWWVWDKSFDTKWNTNVIKLVEFYNKNNKLPTESLINKDERKIARWIDTQRSDYKKGILSKERIEILEKLQYWIWTVEFDLLWNNNLQKLIEFCNKYNRLPENKTIDKDEKRLDTWINNQRKKYKKSILSEKEIKLLEEIKYWNWGFDDKWNKILNEIIIFYKINNRKPIYSSKDKNEKRLGGWISDQITNYNKEILSKERINILEKLKWWSWNILDKQWHTKLQNTVEFYNKNNKIPSCKAKDNDEKSLGMWIGSQRKNKKKGILSKEYIEILEKLNWWKWVAK